MDNLCNNCIHKDVCGRYAATWGMKTCEHYREKRERCEYCKDGKSFIGARLLLGNDGKWHDIRYCPNCGADMRGTECE